MGEYVPIACVAHEQLEFAVLRRQKLLLRVGNGEEGERTLTVMPTDVATRDQAEWLSYRTDSGDTGVIRLDCILGFGPA